jgi:sterol desaturase/sphingolipid hydroxylase (fatty acid hydroxylase superfamily)
MEYIVLAIPVFFALIGVELLVAWVQGRRVYRLADSLADLSCGVVEQLLNVFLKTLLFAGYALVHERARLLEIQMTSSAAWVLGFVGVDFCYYWFHRSSHEVGAIWATHVVHHQSEEYNLSVALRQSAFQSAFSWVFYLPLALAGLPPAMFLALSSFNTLYQFWIHTRTIGRLGPLEGILNTPSNHRVHHARNPKYIDRNHGGTLIVWDRLFGTYAPEEEEPVYGITTPLRTWNPVWANLHYWVELFGKARRATSWGDRLRFFLKPPGWQPEELGGPLRPPEVDRASYRKFDTPAPFGLSGYAAAQFALVLLAASLLLLREAHLSRATLTAGSLGVLVSAVSLTSLLERKRWALALELARVAALGAVALALGLTGDAPAPAPAWTPGVPALSAAALAAAPGFALWLLRYRALFAPVGSPAGS